MKRSRAVIGILASLTSLNAFADTTTGTSTLEAAPASQKLLDKIAVSYLGLFAGPSIGNPSNFQPNDLGVSEEAMANRIVLQNTVSTMYKINSEIQAGIGFNFDYKPIGGENFALVDPSLKLTHSALVKRGTFSLSGDLRYYVPVTTASVAAESLGMIRSTQTTNYDIPNSRFSVGAYTWEKAYLSHKDEYTNLKAYFTPYINFQANKATAIMMFYDTMAIHKSTDSLLSWSAGDPTDLGVGVAYDITPSINVNPFVQIFPGGVINLDSTQIGAYISAKIL